MNISIIAAVSKNNVIGKNNDIPWKLPNDMKYFKKITVGDAVESGVMNHVIMGRKNWESIPEKYRPLPQRINWILTKNVEKFMNNNMIDNAFVVSDLEATLRTLSQQNNEVFVIGGGEIYELALPHANRLYLTEIDATIDGDVFFPSIDKSQWKEVSRVHNEPDEKHAYAYDFVLYERI